MCRRFLEGAVSRLARKPLRVVCVVERLSLGLEVQQGLGALRAYFERLAREYAKKAAR